MHLFFLWTMLLGVCAFYIHLAELPSTKWELALDLVLVFGSFLLFLDFVQHG